MRVTFRSETRGILEAIEGAKKNVKEAKIKGFEDLAKAAFKQANTKYVVKGNFAHKSKSGKSMVYDTPTGANINVRKTVAYNPKTKWRKFTEVPMFIKGKIASRTGEYEEILSALASSSFKLGTTVVKGVKVVITENSLKIFADDQSKFFKLETFKQMKKTAIAPLTKSFRSIVNQWKKIKIKMNGK